MNALNQFRRLRDAMARELTEIENLIMERFPDEFPPYPDDWQKGTQDRCTGEHTAVTLVMKAVDEIDRLRAELGEARAVLDAVSAMPSDRQLAREMYAQTGDKTWPGYRHADSPDPDRGMYLSSEPGIPGHYEPPSSMPYEPFD